MSTQFLTNASQFLLWRARRVAIVREFCPRVPKLAELVRGNDVAAMT